MYAGRVTANSLPADRESPLHRVEWHYVRQSLRCYEFGESGSRDSNGRQPTMTEFTNWTNLTTRRKELLEAIEKNFPDQTFACSELNDALSDATTTRTLNKLCREDNYLRRFPGGNSMLIAQIPGDDNNTAFRLASQEDLAQRMADREGISLDASDYDWIQDAQRQNFASKFNSRSSTVELIPTWTRNKYRLKKATRYEVRASD